MHVRRLPSTGRCPAHARPGKIMGVCLGLACGPWLKGVLRSGVLLPWRSWAGRVCVLPARALGSSDHLILHHRPAVEQPHAGLDHVQPRLHCRVCCLLGGGVARCGHLVGCWGFGFARTGQLHRGRAHQALSPCVQSGVCRKFCAPTPPLRRACAFSCQPREAVVIF